MSKIRSDGGWWRDPSIRGFQYFPPGVYEELEQQVPTKHISDMEVRQLIPLLEDSGLLVPRLDERLRGEDIESW